MTDGQRVLLITLPWPPSVNQHVRVDTRRGKVRVHQSEKFRSYKRRVRSILRSERVRPIEGAIFAILTFVPPDRRLRDASNLEKVVFDAMEGIAYENDRQVVRCWWELRLDPEPPGRAIVRLQRIEDSELGR